MASVTTSDSDSTPDFPLEAHPFPGGLSAGHCSRRKIVVARGGIVIAMLSGRP